VYDTATNLTYTDIIRTALRNRYSFIKYYYANFQDIYYNGGSFFKPLFFEWTLDPLAYKDLDINILLGDALKASINTVDLTAQSTQFYFPQGSWCQILPYPDNTQCFTSQGDDTTGHKTLTTDLTEYYIHIRQGYLIPFQNGTLNHVFTTKDLTKLSTDLIMYPATANSQMVLNGTEVTAAAIGYIFYDDGVTLAQTPTRFNIYLSISATNSATITVSTDSKGKQFNTPDETLGTI
jgi:alpha-glucosidase (family GH31 glycosyl hydrolase)